MKLLYRLSEWHSLAKLRMHTETSLELMEEVTKELGDLLRQFRRLTCSHFSTVELPREANARVRRMGLKGASTTMSNTVSGGGDDSTQNNKESNAQLDKQSPSGGRFLFLY